MRRLLVLFPLLMTAAVGLFGTVQASSPPTSLQELDVFIQRPRAGEALQGIEIIAGKIRGQGFQGAELNFTYAGQENPTWFYLGEIKPDPEEPATLDFEVDWDTTGITDGDYDLRLQADFVDGTVEEVVPDLRIRNYSPIETSTPQTASTPLSAEETRVPTPENTPLPVRTQLPENPLTLEGAELLGAVGRGLAAVGALFALGGVYAGVKRIRRRQRES